MLQLCSEGHVAGRIRLILPQNVAIKIYINGRYAVDPVSIVIVSIGAQLIAHKHDERHADRHGYCKSEYVYKGKEAVTKEIAQGGLKVVFDHAELGFGPTHQKSVRCQFH